MEGWVSRREEGTWNPEECKRGRVDFQGDTDGYMMGRKKKGEFLLLKQQETARYSKWDNNKMQRFYFFSFIRKSLCCTLKGFDIIKISKHRQPWWMRRLRKNNNNTKLVKQMNKTTKIYIHSESSHFNSINMTGFGAQSVAALYSDWHNLYCTDPACRLIKQRSCTLDGRMQMKMIGYFSSVMQLIGNCQLPNISINK